MSNEALDTRTRILAATRQLIEKEGAHMVKMSDIAKAVGISRQAIYLHFATRTELMVETTHYVDELCGLKERLAAYDAASSGTETLAAFVEFWGNYIPEIHALAKALFVVRVSDEAAEAAWQDRMNAVRSGCRRAIERLEREGKLAPGWTQEKAVGFCWTMLSIHNWEQLIIDCRWTPAEYVSRMQKLLEETLIK